MKHLQLLLICAFFAACGGDKTATTKTAAPENALFERVSPDQSGVTFENTVTETEKFNAIFYDGIYWGAGVGVGDFNNDGLQDIFFAGNMTPSKLYLNKGDFKFEDITKKAGVEGGIGWSTGVALADVNADGWLDIYVCRHVNDDVKVRTNLFYVNNGNPTGGGAGGVTFTERSAEYGIADAGYSISANFFDYDKDGWLDLFVVNQPINQLSQRAALFQQKPMQYSNRLYHNNGNGTFSDVTKAAGIENFAFSLSATVSDMDRDGWPDVYVACDFFEPDMFFRNNGNGTFTNIAQSALRHTSNFSMGADIADFNNDGWMDIYVADMVAEDNLRSKTNMSGMNPKQFWDVVKRGGHHQYMFNVMQLNNGLTPFGGQGATPLRGGAGGVTFSEIAQMSGTSNTDWSWSPLFVDFDNDGWKDLYVSNGLLRDVRNKDYHHKGEELLKKKMEKHGGSAQAVQASSNPLEFVKLAPSQKIVNYLYRNKGDLTFEQKMEDWGTNDPTWTHGAAYADFDNDGDMDLVLNNTNEAAILYRNRASERKVGNFLTLHLVGEKPNLRSVGATVTIEYGGQLQVQEISPIRGYMSTSECVAHFGLGQVATVDKMTVRWPDGREIVQQNVAANQRLTLQQKDAKPGAPLQQPSVNGLLQDVSATAGIDFRHQEAPFDDYDKEILLPYRMSHLGPCLATADVNGDKLEDFYVGGAAGQSGALYLQKKGGSFQRAGSQPWSADAAQEDVGALFFDADGDADADLYVCSGSNEFPQGSPLLLDRLYLNTGGSFSKAPDGALPPVAMSSSKASAADLDADGDLDLFIGGRQVPGKYGHPVSSLILRNNKGKFQDATAEVAPQLRNIGMVTDGTWMDFDGDADPDLVLAGEWMPLTFFKNDGGKLSDFTAPMGMDKTHGWWNCLEPADLDGDGDMDLVAGNLGLNIKHKATPERPFKCYIKDFDGNGSNDIYLGYYDRSGVCYPVRGRQCSSQQMPFVAEKFASYEAFAKTDIEHVLEGKLDGAIVHQAFMFESVWLENIGNGQYLLHKLPNEAQTFPVFGIAVDDWNRDGIPDLYLAGNFHEREVETTRSDAGIGCLLMGNSKSAGFTPLRPWEMGALARGDVRNVKTVKDSGGDPLILVANSNEGVQVLRRK